MQVEKAFTVKLNNLSAAECNMIRMLFKGTLDHFHQISKVRVRAAAQRPLFDGTNRRHLQAAHSGYTASEEKGKTSIGCRALPLGALGSAAPSMETRRAWSLVPS